MNTATETTTIRNFQSGICKIEKLPDKPGSNWVKVRFDAQGGGGCQFEVWEDEMPLLERDIQGHFSDMSQIVGLPLASAAQEAKAKPAMPRHAFKRKNPPAGAVDSKQQPQSRNDKAMSVKDDRINNDKCFYWIAINGASCALARYPLPVPTVKPTPELLIGFPTLEEAVEAQHFLLTAPHESLPPTLEGWRLRALLPESDITIVMPAHPGRPTTGVTHWFVGGRTI